MIEDLLRQAALIRDEDKESRNTAVRVGKLFVDIINSQQFVEESLRKYQEEVDRWKWLQVQRGEWDAETAKGDDPYRFFEKECIAPDGLHKYNQVVQHVAFRYGLTWGCIADRTTEEPGLSARDWVLVQKNPGYVMQLYSENGKSFRPNQVDTHIVVTVWDDKNDITALLRSTEGVSIKWMRITGNTAEDSVWQPSCDAGDDLYRIHLRVKDMGTNWIYGYRRVTFLCQVKIPVGAEFLTVEKKLII